MPDVDLTNCEREPIHVPGAIQPHGWLVACDEDGIVTIASANAALLFGVEAAQLLGRPLVGICPLLDLELLRSLSESGEAWDLEVCGTRVTCSAQTTPQGVIIEFEPPAEEPLAIERHLPVFRLARHAPSVGGTLDYVAGQVRVITGFDRVMIYRFLPDLSGEVIAESRVPDVPSYLGLRYPASDIPAQARRLYTINLTRLIVDARYEPVPLVPSLAPDGNPLDLSFVSLRSVSPIHREYLQNMGIAGSFSISIVINGELWGLVACHNRSPKFISHDRRALSELLAQQIATLVDAELRRSTAVAESESSTIGLDIAGRLVAHDEVIQSVLASSKELLAVAGARGVAVTLDGRVGSAGVTPPREIIERLVAALSATMNPAIHPAIREEQYVSYETGKDHEFLAAHADTAAGVMAVRFATGGGWILWFRPEAASLVRWAGDPNKPASTGPLGPRLTPRGSFDEYVLTTRGQSDWWSIGQVHAARRLRELIRDAMLRRTMEERRLRELVISTMSHDLRTPLSAITMAAELMTGPAAEQSLASTITWSSRRMKRLLDNLMELSRIHSGVGIQPSLTQVDLGAVASRIVHEARMSSSAPIDFSSTGDVTIMADETRMEQVLANLISNARHHGDPEAAITVTAEGTGDAVILRVHNWGPSIPEEKLADIFSAYTSRDAGSARGLGIGLFTVKKVVEAHEGSVDVTSDREAGTTFRVTLPRQRGSAG